MKGLMKHSVIENGFMLTYCPKKTLSLNFTTQIKNKQ